MNNYVARIKTIKKALQLPEKEVFEPAQSGTHHIVFLSKDYVVRFRDGNPELLSREAEVLKRLTHPLIPKILWVGSPQSSGMAENRLPGKTLDSIWSTLTPTDQSNIIDEIIQFLQYLRTQHQDYYYSINTGKKYDNYRDLLLDSKDEKINLIKKHREADHLLQELLNTIESDEYKSLFTNQVKIVLVHGDMINHNLLIDGNNLTGILDWELAQFGDPDYDLFRLFYYQERAKAYDNQGIDETFETHFMDKLITAIIKSNLIEDIKQFQKRYAFVRAIFFLNALTWAARSDNPHLHIKELVMLWDKKSGTNIT